MLLPLTNLPAVIFICENKIGLHPRDARPGINQKFADALGINTAILIQLLAALFGDGLNPAFHGDAVRPAQQIKRLFVPEINPSLESNLYWTLSNAFQQPPHILAHTKNL